MNNKTNFAKGFCFAISLVLMTLPSCKSSNKNYIQKAKENETIELIKAFTVSCALMDTVALREKPMNMGIDDIRIYLKEVSLSKAALLLDPLDTTFRWSYKNSSNNTRIISDPFFEGHFLRSLDHQMDDFPGKKIYIISNPIFTKAFDSAFLKYDVLGRESFNEGKLLFFNKKNGKWNLSRILNRWVY